jgi:uncharacterized protein YyaL (SSP411 family)
MIILTSITPFLSACWNDLVKKDSLVFDDAVHLEKTMEWLCRAHDKSKNGGVSEGFHLFHGWLPPYPETTGYIIESFFNYYRFSGREEIKERAVRMGNWLISIQNSDGSIPDSYFRRKLIFDTGQVLFGFASCFEGTKEEKFKDAALLAGQWLLTMQEKDGSWIKFSLHGIPHTYYSRVALGLLRLYEISRNVEYCNAAIKNIEWCLKQQTANGWFDLASFETIHHGHPFTHNMAYCLEGILESGIFLNEKKYITAIARSIGAILENSLKNGRIPGTFDRRWKGDSSFDCLTGNAQLGAICFKLFKQTGEEKYLISAKAINAFLKARQRIQTENSDIRGALAGSYPIWGKYIHFTYPNWAAKFFVDSLLLAVKTSNP